MIQKIVVILLTIAVLTQSMEVYIGSLDGAHKVVGEVYAISSTQIRIDGFSYDGTAPDAYFWGGSGSPSEDGYIIPDENGGTDPLEEYTNKDIILSLPGALDTTDYISVWCREFNANFDHVDIPSDILDQLEASTKEESEESDEENTVIPEIVEFDNCVELFENQLQVSWSLDENIDAINFKLEGIIEDDEWMGFGLSGKSDSTFMVGADVTIAYFDGSEPVALDFDISSRSQCSNGDGVCPDTSSELENDVFNISGYRIDGITTITYSRPIESLEDGDISYATSGDSYVAFGIGPLSEDKLVLKHSVRTPTGFTVDFSETGETCEKLENENTEVTEPFSDLPAFLSDETNIRVTIGPSFGDRGYTHVTGKSSWGIAFYLNGWLIPELEVVRGTTYTFTVETGNDPELSTKNHPFYITTSSEGGIEQVSDSDETVYAGYEDGEPTIAGRHCEIIFVDTELEKMGDLEDEIECDEGEAAILEWTPDDETPDELYYQCTKHKYLGWKITVVDAKEEDEASSSVMIRAVIMISFITWLLV
eukprot:TRINITY_DN9194_c0_g1_i1.p1 TRINITY_DN9194_c0_g1~~TRINITY_DN9194_c0_g1_i1.p1  ORF type:complete len:537 (-),score=166.80 TRINITY_DN9194_c0_g1_i1:52-1662(-)